MSSRTLNTANVISDGEQIYKWSKMFDKLLPSSGLKMRINLPDTILVDSEQKILSWYTTTDGGYISSKNVQRSTLKEAVTEFCANMFEDARVNPNLYVAVAYFADQRRVLLRRSDILNIVRQKDKKDSAKAEKSKAATAKEGAAAKNKVDKTEAEEMPTAGEEVPAVKAVEEGNKEAAVEGVGVQEANGGEDAVAEPAKEGGESAQATPQDSAPNAEAIDQQVETPEEEVEEEDRSKFQDFYSRAFMIQQYFPPSLDRRYVCRYSSDKSSGKVGFSILARRFSDRYTNNLDVSVTQAVHGANQTVNHLLTQNVLPLGQPNVTEGEAAREPSPTKTREEKMRYFREDAKDEVPEHPRDLSFKSDVRKAVTSIVNFMERNHRIQITSGVFEFVRGLEGRPWLVMVDGLPTSRMSRGSASQSRFNTAARESASRLSSRPKSASSMRKSTKFSSEPQVLKIHSRPSSARGLQSRAKSSRGNNEALSSFESSLVEALSQDIEILKEKIQQQNDMLEQTESALKRELDRRKADQIASTNEIIKLREENENLKKERKKLRIECDIYREKSLGLERENFEITRMEDERQQGLKERVMKLESIRDEFKEKCRGLEIKNEEYRSKETAASSEKKNLELRLAEEQETVAAVRSQLVSLRKKLLDSEAKNKELDIKVSTFTKGGKSKRRIIAPEDPAALAMRAEQVVNNLNTHDLMVDYEPGYGDEKENQDVNRIRHKICDVLCNNVEALQDIYDYYAQLGEVNRQGQSLLMNQMQLLKFATDIGYFEEDFQTQNSGEEGAVDGDAIHIDDVDIIFSRIVSKDDTHTRITFTGFLEGICRLAYAKYGSTLKVLIIEEDDGAPDERQARIDNQADVVMTFLANLLKKARWNKLGGSSMNKQKQQWRRALEKSIRIQRLANQRNRTK